MALNRKTIQLDDNNNIFLSGGAPVVLSGNDAIAQNLKFRFRIISNGTHGEWALNTGIGTDYFGEEGIFSTQITEKDREFLIKAKILEDPDILKIIEYQSSITEGVLTVNCILQTVNSAPLTIGFEI